MKEYQVINLLKEELLNAVRYRKTYYLSARKNNNFSWHDFTLHQYYDGKVKAFAQAIRFIIDGRKIYA